MEFLRHPWITNQHHAFFIYKNNMFIKTLKAETFNSLFCEHFTPTDDILTLIGLGILKVVPPLYFMKNYVISI